VVQHAQQQRAEIPLDRACGDRGQAVLVITARAASAGHVRLHVQIEQAQRAVAASAAVDADRGAGFDQLRRTDAGGEHRCHSRRGLFFFR